MSQIERVERAIADHLRPLLPNDVKIDVQPDVPEHYDMTKVDRACLVHFAEVQHGDGPAVRLGGRATYAVICLARSLRGAASGYALVELVEQALAGAALPGIREIRVKRTRLEAQAGGLWRWVVAVETEIVRGRVPAVAAPFIPGFQRSTDP